MRIFILFSFVFISLISCSKEAFDTFEPVEEVKLTFGDLSVTAVRADYDAAAENPTSTNASASNQSPHGENCEPNRAPLTKVGLFKGNTYDAVVKVDDADFIASTTSGYAFFGQLEPGEYTVVGENALGQSKLLKKINLGMNDVILEF